MKNVIKAAIVGSSGYTGEELLRICLRHPNIQVTKITSRQFAGKSLGDFIGAEGDHAKITFENLDPLQVADHADIFFLGLPHGVAAEYAVPLLEKGKIVFDLSADFRLKDAALYDEFYKLKHPAPQLLKESVYGMPELYSEEIKKARLIACPGCYPTSIILALAPALKNNLIDAKQITINSLSGVSGAGRKVETPYLFCECNENLKAYSVPKHRHTPEIEQELSKLAGESLKVSFTPHLVPVTRGMLTTITAPFAGKNEDDVQKIYENFYADKKFVRILGKNQLPETRRLMRTNFIEIACRVDPRTNRLVMISAIDNLSKGAASQAVQAFNVRFGFAEDEGL